MIKRDVGIPCYDHNLFKDHENGIITWRPDEMPGSESIIITLSCFCPPLSSKNKDPALLLTQVAFITMTRRPCAFRQVFIDFLCCCCCFSPTVIIPTAEYKKYTPSVLLWYCCHNFSLIIAILISSTVLLSHGNNCLNLSSENSSWVASLNFACRYF